MSDMKEPCKATGRFNAPMKPGAGGQSDHVFSSYGDHSALMPNSLTSFPYRA